jgi:hypothetical protein
MVGVQHPATYINIPTNRADKAANPSPGQNDLKPRWANRGQACLGPPVPAYRMSHAYSN